MWWNFKLGDDFQICCHYHTSNYNVGNCFDNLGLAHLKEYISSFFSTSTVQLA
jgi:hypothetical protein